jgi:hypothetical protein
MMAQAAALDGQLLDLLPFREDGLPAAEVDGRRQVAQALMVTVVIVVIDEGADGDLELAWEKVVLEQDAVLQGPVPALDLALGLGMVRRAADMDDALALEPPREVACDVWRSVVAEQPGPVDDPRGVASRGSEGELQRVGDVASR